MGVRGAGGDVFPSIPMVLTSGGGEGAHRSWAFSFIGIAVLCGMAWSFGPCLLRLSRVSVLSAARRVCAAQRQDRCRGRRAHRHVCRGRGVGDEHLPRFPGSAHVGDDARSVSREGAAVAAWMAAHAPVDTPVVADRYVSQQVGSVGRMGRVAPSATFPIGTST